MADGIHISGEAVALIQSRMAAIEDELTAAGGPDDHFRQIFGFCVGRLCALVGPDLTHRYFLALVSLISPGRH